jgi:predicted DNA-binding transcriptional regulator YafY
VKDRRKLSETVLRYIRMLQLVPQGPRRIDAASIQSALDSEGIEIHRRSVQRDLELLSASFPGLECDRNSRPFGWSWHREAPLLELPSMNVSTAVTLELVRAYMAPALPRSTLKTLQKYFDRARETLLQSTSSRLARWPKKVRVVPRGQPLHPPKVPDAVLEAVYGCLLDEKRFKVLYRKRGANTDTQYEVCPLGLVVRNGVLMLVCTMDEQEAVKHLALHRMKSVVRLERSAAIPAHFSLEQHVVEGGMGFRYGQPIALKFLMRRQAAVTVREAPLSPNQVISEYDEASDLIEVMLADTLELRGWLASYGDQIEVLQPASLRELMARSARTMSERYASPAPRIRPALRKAQARSPRAMSAAR